MNWIIILLSCILAPRLLAQSTEAELRNRLINKPLYLKGQWNQDSLTFDETGRLVGTFNPVTFALSGIAVTSLKLTNDALVIKGARVGLEFKHDVPRRVELQLPDLNGRSTHVQHMEVTIERPASNDYKDPLDRIFADGLDQMLSALPPYWQDYGEKHFVVPSKPSVMPSTLAPAPATSTSLPVSAPRLLASAEPAFNETARALLYGGKVLLSLQVDQAGKPSHFKIISPIGLGLDDRAVAAVSKYVFAPATQNGTPVAAEVRLEVNFQIY